MTKRKALVLGATGKVGKPLANALYEDGWKVFGAARCTDDSVRESLENTGIETIRFDVTTDDPAILPDVDVLFLEIWDPETWNSELYEYVWSNNYFSVARLVEHYAGRVYGCC